MRLGSQRQIHNPFTWLVVAFAASSMFACGDASTDDPAASSASLAEADALADPISDRGGVGTAEPIPDTGLTPAAAVTLPLDVRKSLIVTDQTILSNFSLTSVLDQLRTQAHDTTLSSLAFFQELWGAELKRTPGTAVNPLKPRCNDASTTGSINGFAVECPRAPEGSLSVNPKALTKFLPVALINRFDLAPTDGSACGEYRIEFADADGQANGSQRAFVIFEASMPNPTPAKGLQGCRPIQQFWADLSDISKNPNVAARASGLKKFYFNGLPGFEPVFQVNHYGGANGTGRGQIRTNQFLHTDVSGVTFGEDWKLREFKLKTLCTGTACTPVFTPASVKVTPLSKFFADNTDPKTVSFQNFFVGAVPGLAVADVNRFNYTPPDTFNNSESDSQVDNFPSTFNSKGPFATRIARAIPAGSGLTPSDIVERAEALSCAGCHEQSLGASVGARLRFPPTVGSQAFVMVNETLEVGPDGKRFIVNPSLSETFLPFRESVVRNFLNTPPPTPPACAAVQQNQTATLSCAPGQVMKAVSFASFGTPTGTCGGAFAVGSCNATSSVGIISHACLGRASCSVPATNAVFGNPCPGTFKRLDVRATCAP